LVAAKQLEGKKAGIIHPNLRYQVGINHQQSTLKGERA
jgi:hypothetical protein